MNIFEISSGYFSLLGAVVHLPWADELETLSLLILGG